MTIEAHAMKKPIGDSFREKTSVLIRMESWK